MYRSHGALNNPSAPSAASVGMSQAPSTTPPPPTSRQRRRRAYVPLYMRSSEYGGSGSSWSQQGGLGLSSADRQGADLQERLAAYQQGSREAQARMANLALQQQQQYTADPGPGNVDELKGKFTLEQFAKRAANSKRGQNDRLFETDDLAKLIALSEDFSNETKYIIDESRIETLFEATIEEDRGFAGFTRDTKLQVLPFLGQIVIWVNKATPGSQLDLRFDEVRNQTVEAILYSIHQSLTGPTGVTSVDASKRHFISIGVLGATIVLLAYMNKKKNIKTEKHYVILRDILRHVATVGVIVDITGGRRVYNYDMPVTENQARSRLACITLIAQAMESMGNTDTGTKTMRLESIGDFLDVATAIFHLHKFAKDVSIDIVDMIGKIISREYAREPKGFSNELMRLLSSMETLGRSDQDRNMKMRVLGFTVAVNQHWDREAYVHSKEQQEQE